MTAGNSNYANIEKFRFDFLFRKVAGGEIPSQKTYNLCEEYHFVIASIVCVAF